MFCCSVVPLRRALVGALSLVAAASAAHAQQLQPSRFVRAPLAAASAAAGDPAVVLAVVPADSVARYLSAARVQRRTGGSLVAVGLATIAGAYVGFARSSRMGMSGGQAATLGAGAIVGALGATRWAASRESLTAAARWSEVRAASAP